MTTNSPNPVDGDVQALIRNIQRRIKNTKRWLSSNKSISNPESEAFELLLIYETALAALTAVPVYQFIVNNPDKDGYIEWGDCNQDYFSNEPSDSRRILYTTQPAQLLRPVDLGDCTLTINNRNQLCMIESEVVEILRQQGFEVKS